MTLNRLGRWRLPAVAAISIFLALGVAGAILFIGNLPALNGNPSPTAPSISPSPLVAEGDTPESAVRAFYDAFNRARETDDPSIIEPFVNGTDSSAYLTASGFLIGQGEVDIASITTVNELTDFEVEIDGNRAIVTFDHLVGGYDIDLDTGEPLESPVVLPERRKTATVVLVDGEWLVDSFENVTP